MFAVLRWIVPGIAAALFVAGCASAPPTARIIAFGDSLSDLGTYAARVKGRTAARYTTNPGPLWIELVAQHYGTTIGPYRQAGWGEPAKVLGGTGYAEGGSRVAKQPGTSNTDATAGPGSGSTTMPLRDQLSVHVGTHGGFGPNDVVFVWSGSNDLFRPAFIAPAATQAEGEAIMREAARDLAAETRRMVRLGARRVVVLNLYDWGAVPGFRNFPKKDWVSAWTAAFNEELVRATQDQPLVIVDVAALFRNAHANPARYGIADATSPACRMDQLPDRIVMFCDRTTLVAPDAHLTHLYADTSHPSTAGHRIIADEVMTALRRSSR